MAFLFLWLYKFSLPFFAYAVLFFSYALFSGNLNFLPSDFC